MKSKKFKVKGVAPLLLHNGQTSDPLNYYAREIKKLTGKRKKSDSDFEEIAKLEWMAGLYVKNGRVIIPAQNLTTMLIGAAKKQRLGQVFQASVFVEEDSILEYSGEKDIKKLCDDEKFRFISKVKVKQNSVMRCRPIFRDWSLEFEVNYFEDSINEADIIEAVKTASHSIGLGDWRPRYGRFEVAK